LSQKTHHTRVQTNFTPTPPPPPPWDLLTRMHTIVNNAWVFTRGEKGRTNTIPGNNRDRSRAESTGKERKMRAIPSHINKKKEREHDRRHHTRQHLHREAVALVRSERVSEKTAKRITPLIDSYQVYLEDLQAEVVAARINGTHRHLSSTITTPFVSKS
jgi:hypothetical protein